MRLWMVLLALAPVACGFRSSDLPGDDGGVNPVDAQTCFGSYVQVCFESAANLPTSPQTWPAGGDIDTDATTSCDQSIKQRNTYCVVTGAGMMLAEVTTLRAHGSKPLILLSTMAVNLQGSVDVSSSGSALVTRGAGGNPNTCTGAATVEADSGGAGGSFAGQGGAGENKGTPNVPTAGPPVSGFPMTPRGGCPGGTGAKAGALLGGAGGSGGGAVAIIAPSVTINGKINASGAGGGGGGPTIGKSGGGGGGSGGMIVLDVPSASITRTANGVLFANGGGGGEGGADPAVMGVDGSSPTAPTPAAPGGVSVAEGGNGGAGSSDTLLAGANAAGQSGGGGGGGGGGGAAGFIYAPGITGSAIISPPSQNLPSH